MKNPDERQDYRLQEIEIRFRSIMESANDAIISIDSKGLVISWNRAAEKLFGYSEEEILGNPLTIIIPEQYRKAHEKGIERVAKTGETHVIGRTVELSGLRKDGTEFPIELSLATWTVDHERFFSGIIRDISERKKAEKVIKSSEMKMWSIMQSANDAIISVDNKGIVISWNKAAAELFGYSEEEVLNKSLTIIIPERYRLAHERGIERVNTTGETRVIGKTVELGGLRRNGTEFPIELSLATWKIDHERFFSGIIRDISERKKAEKALKSANQELKLKNEQLEALSTKLAKYLSRQVYESIFAGKKEVRIESYRKKLTVFFSDIQGFAELTERMEAEELSSLLNNYLDEMSRIALNHGGTIDKFIGDGIMIFFGDPETKGEKEDALACVLMALEMRKHVKRLQRKWNEHGVSVPLNVRMGINTGFCTVGNFGSENRLDYTIVGGQVNIASRLESAAEPNQILISHETYALIKDQVACEPRGEIKVKGIAHPVQTYQVLDLHENLRKKKSELKEEFDGFSLSIDFNTIAEEDKIKALTLLEKAIAKIKENKHI